MSSLWESLSGLFDFGGSGESGGSNFLQNLLLTGAQIGGGLLGQKYQNEYAAEAAEKQAETEIGNQLKLQEELLKLKEKYGLLGGGGGGGGGGAGMYAAQTQRAATLAGLYNEMAKQRLLGAQGTGSAYRNLAASAQAPLLARGR